jgi:hypothetical protein
MGKDSMVCVYFAAGCMLDNMYAAILTCTKGEFAWGVWVWVLALALPSFALGNKGMGSKNEIPRCIEANANASHWTILDTMHVSCQIHPQN